MPVVILSLGVAAISAAVLLDVVSFDFVLQGQERRSREARQLAEGGLMELLNDQRLQNQLPDLEDDNLANRITSPEQSMFTGEGRGDYEAEVRLLRLAPLLESSQGRLQAIMYELVVDGKKSGGHQAGVRAEIYKFAARASGLVQEGRHAR
ncbi:MAG: hypothetical protein AAGD10_01775 [Myxococcota bacterium]